MSACFDLRLKKQNVNHGGAIKAVKSLAKFFLKPFTAKWEEIGIRKFYANSNICSNLQYGLCVSLELLGKQVCRFHPLHVFLL